MSSYFDQKNMSIPTTALVPAPVNQAPATEPQLPPNGVAQPPESASPESQDPSGPAWRHARTGTVARLPKESRDTICRMMQNGDPYALIIDLFARQGVKLTPGHLSEWKGGGYLDWERDQYTLAEMRAEQEFAVDLFAQDQAKLPQLVLSLAVSQVLRTLRDCVPDGLKGKFDSDPSQFTRLINSVGRLSREALVLRKHEEATAAKHLQQLDPNRECSDDEYELIAKKMDQAFKIRRPPPPPAPNWDEVMI
jgi:hypothetical protein